MENRDVTFKNLTEEQINAIKVLLGDACDIEQQEEEQKEEEETSFPKYGSKYYFIDGDEVCESFWYDDMIDRGRLSLGNCFKTREEAEFKVERLKVLHEMKKFAEPKDYAWDEHNFHYYIYYRFSCDDIGIDFVISSKSNDIYFKSREDAEACIEAVGKDKIKKYYLGKKYYLEVEDNG